MNDPTPDLLVQFGAELAVAVEELHVVVRPRVHVGVLEHAHVIEIHTPACRTQDEALATAGWTPARALANCVRKAPQGTKAVAPQGTKAVAPQGCGDHLVSPCVP